MTGTRRFRLLILAATALTVLGLLPATVAVADEPPPGPVSGTLVPGTPRTLAFTSARQRIILRLYAHAGSDLRFAYGNYSSSTLLNELDYDTYGPVHDGTAALIAGSVPIYGAVRLPDTGWYTLDLYSDRTATGSIDVTAELSAGSVDAGSVAPGRSVAVTFSSTQEVAVHFFGRAGQRPDVFCSQLDLGDDPLGNPGVVAVYFEGPDGTLQTASPEDYGCGDFPMDGSFDYAEGRVLDQTGRWTMLFAPSATGTGTFRFGLSRDAPVTALPTGMVAHVAVTQPGANVYRTVHLTQGDKLTLPLSAVSSSQEVSPVGESSRGVFFYLYRPDQPYGNPLLYGSTAVPRNGEVVAFPAAAVTGTYLLEVDGAANTLFSFTTTPTIVHDQDLTVTPGTPTTVTIAQPGQDAKLHFHVRAGQTLSVTYSGSTFPKTCAAGSCAVDSFYNCDACAGNGTVLSYDVRKGGTASISSSANSNVYVSIDPIGNTTGSVTVALSG